MVVETSAGREFIFPSIPQVLKPNNLARIISRPLQRTIDFFKANPITKADVKVFSSAILEASGYIPAAVFFVVAADNVNGAFSLGIIPDGIALQGARALVVMGSVGLAAAYHSLKTNKHS